MKHLAPAFALIASAVLISACTHDSGGSGGSGAAQSPVAAAPTPPPAAATAAAEGEEHIDVLADADPDSGEAPLRVQFSADAVLDADANEPTYTWNFGDGSPPSNERNPTHVYEKPGEYLATVRVVNKIGEYGTDEVEIEVEHAELPAGEQ
jgi:PKD repeat protein